MVHGLQSLKVGLGISVVSHGGDMRIERSCGLRAHPFPPTLIQADNVFDEANSVTLLATNGHR